VATGSFSTGEIGSWSETWYVGGVTATPVLNFTVSAPPPPPCTGNAVAFPGSIFSTDFYVGADEEPTFIEPGSTYVGAAITGGSCIFAYSNLQVFGYPSYMSASVTTGPYDAVGTVFDNESTGAYGFAGRCRDCFYPIVEYSMMNFVAVDSSPDVTIFDIPIFLWIVAEYF